MGDSDRTDTQDTVFDPYVQAFATLTPINRAAKVAFSEVVDSTCLTQDHAHHKNFMHIEQEQISSEESSIVFSQM
jgi:hypothetical protein